MHVCSVAQLLLTLCDPMDCNPPGSSIHEIFQAMYWTALPCPSPWDLPDPGIEPTSLALVGYSPKGHKESDVTE